jgi:signal transduction histidine kinase
MGLHIMRYRADMIGARLDVASTSGGGTTITCSFGIPT